MAGEFEEARGILIIEGRRGITSIEVFVLFSSLLIIIFIKYYVYYHLVIWCGNVHEEQTDGIAN